MHAWTRCQTHTLTSFPLYLSTQVVQYFQHVNKSLYTTCSAVNSWNGAVWGEKADISWGFSTVTCRTAAAPAWLSLRQKRMTASAGYITSHCSSHQSTATFISLWCHSHECSKSDKHSTWGTTVLFQYNIKHDKLWTLVIAFIYTFIYQHHFFRFAHR